ncbi:MAG: hypothetical protein HKN27_07010 [Silicimonas sp.]|nr:hypothetical protein [Silicimonas sp.]
MPNTKIATCCYCGSRAALVLRGHERHELACANCGAPLHDLKMLRKDHDGARGTVRLSRARPAAHLKPAWDERERDGYDPRPRHTRRKPKKRRKSTARWLLEEAWDVIEDIFD